MTWMVDKKIDVIFNCPCDCSDWLKSLANVSSRLYIMSWLVFEHSQRWFLLSVWDICTAVGCYRRMGPDGQESPMVSSAHTGSPSNSAWLLPAYLSLTLKKPVDSWAFYLEGMCHAVCMVVGALLHLRPGRVGNIPPPKKVLWQK